MPLRPAFPTYRPPARSLAAQTRTHRHVLLPSPIKGLDTSRPYIMQDRETATELINWWVRKWGPELRGGSKRWTTNLGGVGTEASVVTLMAYRAPPGAAGTVEPRLFAACDDGDIYNVTDQTDEVTTPAAAQAVASQSSPGKFSYVNISVGGTNYLACVSAGGGYWTYDHVGGWVNRTANVTGVSASTFDFITVWKNRIWFIEKDTPSAWYLPVDSIQGAAAEFDFGPLLAHGGSLSVLASWTIDAGAGIDDRMVAIGSEGDVLIYQGTDPTSPDTFAMVGRWYVGKVPSGRRYATQHGGDLSIITERGMEYLSRVLSGRGLMDPNGMRDDPSFRFNEVIAEEVRDTRGQDGWAILYHPGQEAVIITTPDATGTDALQFALGTLSQGWSTFEGMPMNCIEVYEGELYFGDTEGKVYQAFTANTDDELSDGTEGDTIQGEVTGAFVTDPELPMSLKRALLIQPLFQAPSEPSLQARLLTEQSSSGILGAPSFSGSGSDVWNTGVWNTAVWGAAQQAFQAWLGVTGLGTHFSLRMAVQGLPGTIFTGWMLVYELGGIM